MLKRRKRLDTYRNYCGAKSRSKLVPCLDCTRGRYRIITGAAREGWLISWLRAPAPRAAADITFLYFTFHFLHVHHSAMVQSYKCIELLRH